MIRLLVYVAFIQCSFGVDITCDPPEYKSIWPNVEDSWCMSNCNHNPRYCPDSHCACDTPTTSPTKPPTNNPTSPTSKSPTAPTTESSTSTTPSPICGECPVCSGYPTKAPTQRPDNGPFDNHCNCICYGDPHCKMWNCAINNWQGPRGVYPPGMVYLMTRCNGETLENMPFDLITSIQRYDNDFTAIDYTIIKLYDVNNPNEGAYCCKIKGNEGVKCNDDCSDNYDIIPNQNEIMSVINDKFKINWYSANGYTHFTLNIEGNACNDDLEIISQTVWSKEESVEIKTSDCYKPYTCGMCGNFYNTGLRFERIDGSDITLSEGCWDGTANDQTGLSYLIEGTMGTQRRLQTDTNNNNEPCFGLIDDIETECIAIIEDEYSDCCSTRSEYCSDDIVLGCSWDSCSCIMTEADSLTQVNNDDTLNQCVSKILSKAMNFTCNLPADDFIVPDMSIYEEEEHEFNQVSVGIECEDNSVSYIFIGIAIGAIICVIINVIIYYFVLKPKLYGQSYLTADMDTDQE